MGYGDTLDYLYRLQRFGIRLGLDNVRRLLTRLGEPQQAFRSVHVAGSKGKGSVCAFLESVLRQAGHRTGLYTSPHLVRFNERIQVNGEEISDEDVVRLTEAIRPHADALAKEDRTAQPTFFEFTTALAFLYFKEREVDIAIVEVGMGGRLDATNVLTPEVSVITRIELEHTQYLGKTLGRIAREKAGIVKAGIPVWTVDQQALSTVERRCRELGSPVSVLGRDLEFTRKADGLEGQTLVIGGGGEYPLSLLGTYQAENAALTYGVVQALRKRGWRISETSLRRGLERAWWPARLQLFHSYPAVIIDSTHTPAGAARLMESLLELFPRRKALLVTGALEDKDLPGIVRQLAPLLKEIILTEPESERALAAEAAAKSMPEDVPVEVVRPVARAVETALRRAGPLDMVLVTGSLYTAGEATIYLEGWRRDLLLEMVRRLKERYMPGEFATSNLETALGKITRATRNPFHVLISTVLSQRTADPTTEVVSRHLFSRFPDAATLASADLEEVEEAIRPANFYKTKARAIREIARIVSEDYGGTVPEELGELMSMPLVGRKTANCVLVYGFGLPAIPIDVHCHRIPNRLGVLRTEKEIETEKELETLLPRELWVEVNELFVRHGQTTCKPLNPDCPSCNLADLCAYNLQRRDSATSQSSGSDSAASFASA